ncbi:hypothetical protein PtA15_4A555 [Puccinia triticina]|uniref:Uncharacterized protein n=1 Tax=Puccinia triticina TaxID=208348 RepID=A0ABY7CFU3_9BASI|nr:uncharacterized protein PtA15_4A555 [Puccinia triticina]WAQ84104.1 hypothetical protein PtA15_4A555 [Puccinia triticina]
MRQMSRHRKRGSEEGSDGSRGGGASERARSRRPSGDRGGGGAGGGGRGERGREGGREMVEEEVVVVVQDAGKRGVPGRRGGGVAGELVMDVRARGGAGGTGGGCRIWSSWFPNGWEETGVVERGGMCGRRSEAAVEGREASKGVPGRSPDPASGRTGVRRPSAPPAGGSSPVSRAFSIVIVDRAISSSMCALSRWIMLACSFPFDR